VTKINLYDPGKEDFIDYSKYGEIVGAGTENYKYLVKDQEGLSLAVGEAIYPNTTSVRWDPAFKAAMKEKRLEGDQWDFLQSPDLEAAFFKWALASEPQVLSCNIPGLFSKGRHYNDAIKCYYAIVVHYPAVTAGRIGIRRGMWGSRASQDTFYT
jgi:beta-glucuronidase